MANKQPASPDPDDLAAEVAAVNEAAKRETESTLSVSPEEELAAVEAELAEVDSRMELIAERDQFRTQLQYLQAEFENYRKRVQRQLGESGDLANEKLVAKLLPVLDTIDLALAHEPNGSLEQVHQGILSTLTKEGLEKIPAVNEPFDPELHEAVAHEPGDGEPTVSEDLRAGYRWKGRVVRPSMVKVMGA